MNAPIKLLQAQVAFLREYLTLSTDRQGTEQAERDLIELGDALDLLRGAR